MSENTTQKIARLEQELKDLDNLFNSRDRMFNTTIEALHDQVTRRDARISELEVLLFEMRRQNQRIIMEQESAQ